MGETDIESGVVKTYWREVRHRVGKVEPHFTKLIDDLDPGNQFPVYLVYLPYGALKGDTCSSFLPTQDGHYYRLSDPHAPKDIIKHLAYGKDSSPLGMVLEKELEYFIDLPTEGITIPNAIYKAGAFFPLSRMLAKKGGRTYAPNGLLTVTSGSRSAFMLPNIGCVTNHVNLQRDFNIKTKAAKRLYDHWFVFKELVNTPIVNSNWRSCLMYFSEKWVDKLHHDKAWLGVKLYLQELGWRNSEYLRNRVYYDIMFSMIQKSANLKPNPYLADTAKHLYGIALGEAPGYVPATNENSLPLSLIQKIFTESYGLRKYVPTILHPDHLQFEESNQPVYYSLQHPSTFSFSPKSRKISSTLFELRELQHILESFTREVEKNHVLFADTVIQKIAQQIEFDFFHNQVDRHKMIKQAKDLFLIDKRFSSEELKQKKSFGFAGDAHFLRGCVSVRRA